MDTRKQALDDTDVGLDSEREPYVAPRVRDFGTLRELTREVGGAALGMSAQNAGVSTPLTITAPPEDGQLGGGGPGGVPTGPDVLTDGGSSPAGTGGEGGSLGGDGVASTGAGRGTGGELPFTGFPVAVVGALGGFISATGMWLRRKLRD